MVPISNPRKGWIFAIPRLSVFSLNPVSKTTGLLIPAFSTRRQGDLGIGDTLGMREWVDWAAEYGVGFLQLLPIHENGSDESPYSAISSIALDPIYLALRSTRDSFRDQIEN